MLYKPDQSRVSSDHLDPNRIIAIIISDIVPVAQIQVEEPTIIIRDNSLNDGSCGRQYFIWPGWCEGPLA